MIAALDLEAARAGIERDFDELVLAGWFGAIVLAIILGLPVMSLVSVLAKQWLALIPLAISVALGALWVAYYATDWIGPESGPLGLWLVVACAVGGWCFLASALTDRRRTPSEKLR